MSAQIRVLTPRDRKILITAMEIVAEELAKGNGRPGILYRIRDELTDLWNGFDVEEVFKAMEKGWDKGRGWEG